MIRIVEADEAIDLLKKREAGEDGDLAGRVAGIIGAVRSGGDAALCRICGELDGCLLAPDRIRVSGEEIRQAREKVDSDFLRALGRAADNIRAYHQKQVVNSWIDCAREGVVLGQLVRPLRRVGIYVPGGKASYPSSVLMNAIPAAVAGVEEIAMATPPGRDGEVDPHTLAAAAEAGVTEIYRIGGAQAIAALAYGTETVRPVDKITGPGNRYVTMAKRLVFGAVDIDMLAGPSEVLVVADSSANPAYVAADLLSQAEHDEMAAVMLVTPDRELARQVGIELERQLKSLERSEIAAAALSGYGAIIITGSVEEAVELANRIAPEHLELMVRDPFSWLGRVKAAGAVFLGHYSPEPVGDYLAGPNHVLPTGGTARFFSPLGVDQFIRRTSLVYYSRDALHREAPDIVRLASVERLGAHARSVEIRMSRNLPEGGRAGFDKGDEVSSGPFDIIQKSPAGTDGDPGRGGPRPDSLSGLPAFPDRGRVVNADKLPGFGRTEGGGKRR
ncbi:MAG: histidinol dehydrogenase [Peptococcaceae bacterium]|nr:histidinol dehydrogenase [Peptococcaceae bacterium]